MCLYYYDSKYTLFPVCTITFFEKIEGFTLINSFTHGVALHRKQNLHQLSFVNSLKRSIRSSAERAIKTERKLSVSLFTFNETVVCVNNNQANKKICFI